MRVLHVTPYFYPAWLYGGVARAVWEIARAQARAGDAVRVLTTDVLDETRRDPGPPLRREEGIAIRYLPNLSNRLAQRAQGYFPRSGWEEAAAWVREADVVHFHCHRVPFFHALAPALAGRPYALSPHGSAGRLEGRRGRKRLYDRFLGDRFLAGAARVFALSEIERADLLARGVPVDRIRLVPHGVDWNVPRAACAARRAGTQAGRVLFLGKVTPLKGLDALLAAVARMPEVRLTVAGNDNGGALARLAARAARPDLAGRVRFAGFLDGVERDAAFAAADALVLPSRYDAFGLAALEALARGVPVAASRRVGCAEALAAEGLAVLVEPDDPASIAAGLAAALASAERGEVLARRARERLAGRFAWTSAARAYRDAYVEISLGGGNGLFRGRSPAGRDPHA